MADTTADRSRRHRRHRDGDHSLCRSGCGTVGRPSVVEATTATGALRAAVEAEFPVGDPLSRALALRLCELAAGSGAAAVQAVKTLGELTAAQRGDFV